MKKILYLIIYIASGFGFSFSQTVDRDISRNLQQLYDRILFTSSDEEKVRLNDSILLIIEQYVASDSVMVHKFNNLRFLGQTLASDSRVKIITWNLLLRAGQNNYYCYIIHKGSGRKKNSIYKLTGRHLDEVMDKTGNYSADNWYGALYYSIQPCRKDYVVLGYDFRALTSRKIIDVLRFTPDGKILFGKELFHRKGETFSREVIEYSSESVVSLRFSTQRLIVFDRLEAFSSGDNEDSQSMGSGLAFDGYVYKKGIWNFVENVDVRNARK